MGWARQSSSRRGFVKGYGACMKLFRKLGGKELGKQWCVKEFLWVQWWGLGEELITGTSTLCLLVCKKLFNFASDAIKKGKIEKLKTSCLSKIVVCHFQIIICPAVKTICLSFFNSTLFLKKIYNISIKKYIFFYIGQIFYFFFIFLFNRIIHHSAKILNKYVCIFGPGLQLKKCQLL